MYYKKYLLANLCVFSQLYAAKQNLWMDFFIKFASGWNQSMHTCFWKYSASFYLGLIGDVPVMLAKPQTFMNASGESVSKYSTVASN
jgi:peptidyl-tRNA hydrolase